MKSIIKILVIFLLTLSTSTSFAQPPNPNNGDDPSAGNNTVNGGDAPIGGEVKMDFLVNEQKEIIRIFNLTG